MLLAYCPAIKGVLLASCLRDAIRLLRALGLAGRGCYEVWDVATMRSVCLLVSHGDGTVIRSE